MAPGLTAKKRLVNGQSHTTSLNQMTSTTPSCQHVEKIIASNQTGQNRRVELESSQENIGNPF